MMKLIFTKELPTKTGVYWRKPLGEGKLPDQEPRICLIIERDDKLVHCSNMATEHGTPLKWFNNGFSEWCGPLITLAEVEMNSQIDDVAERAAWEFANDL